MWLDGRQARLRFVSEVLLVHAILLVFALLAGRLLNFIEKALHYHPGAP